MIGRNPRYIPIALHCVLGETESIYDITLGKSRTGKPIDTVTITYGPAKIFSDLTRLRRHMCGVYEPLSAEWYKIMSSFVIYDLETSKRIPLNKQFGFHPGNETINQIIDNVDEEYIARELLGGADE